MTRSAVTSNTRSLVSRGLTLEGLPVVDCAHGAAYKSTPCVLRELGAEVFVYRQPAGRNEHQQGLRLDAPGNAVPRSSSIRAHLASRTTATPTASCCATKLAI